MLIMDSESHRCEVNTSLGTFACDFSMFFRFLKGFILENRLQYLNGMTDFNEKIFLNSSTC